MDPSHEKSEKVAFLKILSQLSNADRKFYRVVAGMFQVSKMFLTSQAFEQRSNRVQRTRQKESTLADVTFFDFRKKTGDWICWP